MKRLSRRALADELLRRLKEQLIDSGNVLVFQPAAPGIPPFRLCTVEELKTALATKPRQEKQ